ncbi:polysaccharide biosynthesis/export family protein [Acidobacterium capsulatum]
MSRLMEPDTESRIPMTKASYLLILLVCFSSCCMAQTQKASTGTAPVALTVQAPPAIQISPGDQISVNVFDIPDLSVDNARVSQGGTVSLPVAGPIHVAGMTADEAAHYIEHELVVLGLVLHPTVTVSLGQSVGQGATIMGQVASPGIYPTFGSRRLLDMLTLAGGVTPSAGKLVTIIHRGDPQHPVHVGLAESSAGLRSQANPIILPGDTVVVAKAGIIYMVGAVGHPGGYLINNNEHLTLLQALALAGGNAPAAKLNSAILIRKLPTGTEAIHLNLKKLYEDKQADFLVADGDILYMPSSFVKSALFFQAAEVGAQLANTAVITSTVF